MRSAVGLQVEQFPGRGLRIVLFKVGEEVGVREVLQLRQIFPHPAGVPVDEGCNVAVVMESLVGAGVVAQVGAGTIAGHSSAGNTRNGLGVVGGVWEGGVAHIVGSGHGRGLP